MTAASDPRDASAADDLHFELEVTGDGSRVTMTLLQELDPHTAPHLRAAVDALDDGTDELVLDLAGVTFIDSSGLREILRAQDAMKAAGGRLVLRSPSRTARRLFEISGLVEHLDIE